jgi:carbon monoxide dehydrogenase subunit G
MLRFELSLEIARPAHEVWEYLIDPENVPDWQASAASSHQLSDGPMGVGTHLQDERRFLGRRARSEVEVTEFEPERLFTLHGISGPVRFTVRHRLEDRGGHTHLAIEAEADPSGIGRLMRPMVEHAAVHEIRKDFDRLKSLLEAGSSAGSDLD